MSLNELIAQSGKFQAPDLIGQYAAAQGVQRDMQQNALNTMKMDELRRATEDQNRLRSAYAGITDYNDPTILNRIGAISPNAAMGMGEYQRKVLESKSKVNKEGAEAVATALKNSRIALDGVTTPEQYLQWHLGNHSDPVLGEWLKQRGVTPESAMKRIQEAMTSPEKFQNMINESKIGAEKTLENNFSNFDTGQQIGVNVMPKYGSGAARVVPGTVMDKQLTPGAAEANDIARGNLEVSRGRLKVAQDELTRKKEGMVELPPKEIQKREAAYPTATAAIKGVESSTDNFIRDLTALRDHPGLNSITGIAAGRMPGITDEGRAAKALYDKVVSKGGFQVLQDIRAASKTGGGLGSISDKEGQQLKSAFAAIDRTQEVKDIRAAIDAAISEVQGSKARMREAYDSTYEYKASKANAPANAGKTLTPQDREALDWANKNPTDPRAIAIKQYHGG